MRHPGVVVMARLALRLLFALAALASALPGTLPGPGTAAVTAQELPAPDAIVLRLGDLPPGFNAVPTSSAPSVLPDGLARQAVAEFQNDATPPMTVRQTVLRFDGRDAGEYLP